MAQRSFDLHIDKGAGLNTVTNDHIEKLRKKTKKRDKGKTDTNIDFSFKVIPVSDAFINKLCEELPAWVRDNQEAKFLTEFLNYKGLTWDCYQKLCVKHAHLKEANDMAKRMMGERMFSRAVDNKSNWAAVKHRLYSYAPEFKQDDEYQAALKAKEKGDVSVPQERYIVLDSNLVRVSEEKDEME